MKDELIDICDENNCITGAQKMKGEAHHCGLWHRAAHVWIYNQKGEILLQLRAQDKSLYPNLWDISVAGHVCANEDPIESAVREVKEEIGLTVQKHDLHFYHVRKASIVSGDIKNNEFYYIYLLEFDGDSKDMIVQDDEVQEVCFLLISKFTHDLRIYSDRYVPHGEYWLDMIHVINKKING